MTRTLTVGLGGLALAAAVALALGGAGQAQQKGNKKQTGDKKQPPTQPAKEKYKGFPKAEWPPVNTATVWEVDPKWPQKPKDFLWGAMSGIAVDRSFDSAGSSAR